MSANLEHQILTECRDYVTAHGDDLELPDYLRLTAKVWEILGRISAPNMGPVDEIIQCLTKESVVDNNETIPGVYLMGSPERGTSLNKWKDRNDAEIRASLGALTWKGIYS